MSPEKREGLRLPPLSTAAGGPLYEQIVTAIKREIAAERLKSGAALPSFRVLAEDLLVSVITVKRAYEELEREGIIFCRQGLGTFVALDGARRTHDAQRQHAITLLHEALREARGVGLSEPELLRIFHTQPTPGDKKSWKTKHS